MKRFLLLALTAGLLSSCGGYYSSYKRLQSKKQQVIEEAIEKCKIRYSQFIEAVQQKQVSRVIIAPSSRRAQIHQRDGKIVWVDLLLHEELIQLLADNDVDISVASSNDYIDLCP